MSDIKVFTNVFYEPFAVFRFGTAPFDITKESAAERFCEQIDPDGNREEIAECASGPGVFHLRHDGTDSDYAWSLCEAKDAGAVPCFGVTWR